MCLIYIFASMFNEEKKTRCSRRSVLRACVAGRSVGSCGRGVGRGGQGSDRSFLNHQGPALMSHGKAAGFNQGVRRSANWSTSRPLPKEQTEPGTRPPPLPSPSRASTLYLRDHRPRFWLSALFFHCTAWEPSKAETSSNSGNKSIIYFPPNPEYWRRLQQHGKHRTDMSTWCYNDAISENVWKVSLATFIGSLGSPGQEQGRRTFSFWN